MGLDSTQRGARQANSFPIAEQVGGGSADLNHMVVKKKKQTRSGWQGGVAGQGMGFPHRPPHVPPPVAPNKYLQWTPGLVALAGVGMRQPYFRQRSK